MSSRRARRRPRRPLATGEAERRRRCRTRWRLHDRAAERDLLRGEMRRLDDDGFYNT
jgi:hypothetical protein